MSKIYVTGDTHRDFSRFDVSAFPEQLEMTKDDYVIICGDFGGVWYGKKRDRYTLDQLEAKPFTTLFVDGNHCNFPELYRYPVGEFGQSNVHFIRPTVIHLMRGMVYNIGKHKCFTMGGAESHDKEWRTPGKSWWPQEMPSRTEYDTALNNLDAHNWSVDFVFSHCAPDSVQGLINLSYGHDMLTNFLETVKSDLDYKSWFFGHYHVNKKVDDKHFCLYEQIVRIA